MLSQQASTMNKLTIIRLLFFFFWPAAVVCDCHLREDAGDLLYVDYVSVFNFTYVDMIEVGMKERKTKFGRLLFNEGCSEKIKNTTKLSATLYKRSEGKPSELVDEKKQKTRFRFEELDPCTVYEVNVTIGNHEVGSYTVGPYYAQDDVQHPFLSSEENREYEKREGEIKSVTPFKDRAVIELGPVCARMVMLHLREKSNGTTHRWDQEKTTILNVTESMTPHKEVGAILEVENLQPCTQYTVDIELWLDDESPTEEGDFMKDQVFDFFTMPDYDENSTSEQRHLRRKMNVVKSEDVAKLPKECYNIWIPETTEDYPSTWMSNTTKYNASIWKPKNERESQILQIMIGISLLVILVATILACSLTLCKRQRGQLEMKKLLPDSTSQSPSPPAVFRTIVPIEPDPETDEQTVVLLKYADLSKTY